MCFDDDPFAFSARSPRWLAKVNRTEEAITTLARIQAKGDVNDPLVVAEWEEITIVLAAERSAALAGANLCIMGCGVALSPVSRSSLAADEWC